MTQIFIEFFRKCEKTILILTTVASIPWCYNQQLQYLPRMQCRGTWRLRAPGQALSRGARGFAVPILRDHGPEQVCLQQLRLLQVGLVRHPHVILPQDQPGQPDAGIPLGSPG